MGFYEVVQASEKNLRHPTMAHGTTLPVANFPQAQDSFVQVMSSTKSEDVKDVIDGVHSAKSELEVVFVRPEELIVTRRVCRVMLWFLHRC